MRNHRRWDESEPDRDNEHYKHSICLLLKLFHIRSHWKRRRGHLELQIRVPSRLLQYRLIHKLRIQWSDILTRDIQQRRELELLSPVVRFIYKVRAVAVGLHLALESGFEYILVEFS